MKKWNKRLREEYYGMSEDLFISLVYLEIYGRNRKPVEKLPDAEEGSKSPKLETDGVEIHGTSEL